MSIHLHRSRRWFAWILTILAVSPFALCFGSSKSNDVYLAPVTGHVTLQGRPAAHLILCLDQGAQHCSLAWIDDDGTFHLNPYRWDEGGMRPGHYKVHLFDRSEAPSIPKKYENADTSGVSIDVARDWNDFQIDLP